MVWGGAIQRGVLAFGFLDSICSGLDTVLNLFNERQKKYAHEV
jgi:hypothetical protein